MTHPKGLTKDDYNKIIRWHFEEDFRDEVEQGSLNDQIAEYKDIMRSNVVPADVMAYFRARARVARQLSQPPYFEDFMEDFGYESSSDDGSSDNNSSDNDV